MPPKANVVLILKHNNALARGQPKSAELTTPTGDFCGVTGTKRFPRCRRHLIGRYSVVSEYEAHSSCVCMCLHWREIQWFWLLGERRKLKCLEI